MIGGTKNKVKKLLCTGIVILALSECSGEATTVTTLYEFIPDQSTVIWHHGFTGWSIPHSIEGQFQLSVDFDARIASFDWVDAILTNGQPPSHHPDFNMNGHSLGEIFIMTELVGTVISDTAINFESQFDPESSLVDVVLIELTFIENWVYLTGSWEYSEPIPDASGFSLDAVAVPEPAMLFLVGLGVLLLRRRN